MTPGFRGKTPTWDWLKSYTLHWQRENHYRNLSFFTMAISQGDVHIWSLPRPSLGEHPFTRFQHLLEHLELEFTRCCQICWCFFPRFHRVSLDFNQPTYQWPPIRDSLQVGMAAQKGTVERLRQSGVGALSNAFGMAAFLRWEKWGKELGQAHESDSDSMEVSCRWVMSLASLIGE